MTNQTQVIDIAKRALPMLPGSITQVVGVGGLGAALINGIGNFGISVLESAMPVVLPVAGVVAGLANIRRNERMGFLLATIALGGGSLAVSALPAVGGLADSILQSIALFALPAAAPVALMELWEKIRK